MSLNINYNFIIFIIDKKIIINAVKNTPLLNLFCFYISLLIFFFNDNWQIYPYIFTRKYTFCHPLQISSGREVYPAPPCPLKSQNLLKRSMCGNKWCRQAAVNCGLFSIWWLCLIVEHMQEQEIAWMSSSDESRMLWKESDERLSGGLYYHVFYMIIKKYFFNFIFFIF
jgi:hypothetical protein